MDLPLRYMEVEPQLPDPTRPMCQAVESSLTPPTRPLCHAVESTLTPPTRPLCHAVESTLIPPGLCAINFGSIDSNNTNQLAP